MRTDLDINFRVNEAETCRSMKLFRDSLRIYVGILAAVPIQDTDMKAKIQNRIRLLKQEISDYKDQE